MINRIQWATIQSQIAVFRGRKMGTDGKINKKEGLYSVFANTVQTQARIRDNDEQLVGVFYRGTTTKKLYLTLGLALK
jgi:hypothetical protein